MNGDGESSTAQGADEVHAEIDRIQKALPRGIQIQPFYDQSLIVHQSIASVRDAILIGLVLASIILVVFLRDWGTSIVAGVVVSVSFFGTFISLNLLWDNFYLLTPGGLPAAPGLWIYASLF